MTTQAWSVVLQWSRVGISAVLFLIAARFLTLAELGLFATAFAPVRLTQSLHRVGIGEAVIVYGKRPVRLDALFALSVLTGSFLAAALAVVGAVSDIRLLLVLALVPLVNGFGAVSEALLRKALRIRALALRTLVVQSLAAVAALLMLLSGWGAGALVAFALLNAVLSNVVSIWLAGWTPERWAGWQDQRLILPKVAQITSRDLLGSGLLPVIQMLVAGSLGLTAAGAFQIAVRLSGLIDAMVVAPIRFTALPRLRQTAHSGFASALRDQLRLTATVSAWVWGGTIAAAPEIVTLVAGSGHAQVVTPVLRALAGFGLFSALVMPISQALIARGAGRLVLGRSAFLWLLGCLLTPIALPWGAAGVAATLSLSALIVTGWYLPRALDRLALPVSGLSETARPLAAGLVMVICLFAVAPGGLLMQVAIGTVIYAAILLVRRGPVRVPA